MIRQCAQVHKSMCTSGQTERFIVVTRPMRFSRALSRARTCKSIDCMFSSRGASRGRSNFMRPTTTALLKLPRCAGRKVVEWSFGSTIARSGAGAFQTFPSRGVSKPGVRLESEKLKIMNPRSG